MAWPDLGTELASYSKKSTISSREIQTSVRLILPGELSKHAISEGTKSVTKVRPFLPHLLRILITLAVLELDQVNLTLYLVLYYCTLLFHLRETHHVTSLSMAEFELTTSLRYDPELLTVPGNTPPSPFLLLPYHLDRLVQAASHFEWPAAVNALSGDGAADFLRGVCEGCIDRNDAQRPLRVSPRRRAADPR